MSLYGQYIKEREGKDIVENDYGFATYMINKDNSCYIESIYVIPDARHDHVASQLADEIAYIAKSQGCNTLLGSVSPSANHSTSSLKVLLAYGFQLDSATNNFILMRKEI